MKASGYLIYGYILGIIVLIMFGLVASLFLGILLGLVFGYKKGIVYSLILSSIIILQENDTGGPSRHLPIEWALQLLQAPS